MEAKSFTALRPTINSDMLLTHLSKYLKEFNNKLLKANLAQKYISLFFITYWHLSYFWTRQHKVEEVEERRETFSLRFCWS